MFWSGASVVSDSEVFVGCSLLAITRVAQYSNFGIFDAVKRSPSVERRSPGLMRLVAWMSSLKISRGAGKGRDVKKVHSSKQLFNGTRRQCERTLNSGTRKLPRI